jgi:hypothetical protein
LAGIRLRPVPSDVTWQRQIDLPPLPRIELASARLRPLRPSLRFSPDIGRVTNGETNEPDLPEPDSAQSPAWSDGVDPALVSHVEILGDGTIELIRTNLRQPPEEILDTVLQNIQVSLDRSSLWEYSTARIGLSVLKTFGNVRTWLGT